MTRSYTYETKMRISSLIPSKWFHKLKNMTKPNKKNPLPLHSKSLLHSSNSSSRSYFSNRSHPSLESKNLQISPRNSLHMKQNKRKTIYIKPSPPSSSSSASSNLKLTSSIDDIISNINNKDFKKRVFKDIKVNDSNEKASSASNLTKEKQDSCRIQKKHEQTLISNGRRSSSTNSPRMKLRVSSPRIQVQARRSKSKLKNRQVLESFAIIKNSFDPKRDFRESMVEMIAENNIRAFKDLENLLACYLSLNHKEYHDLIIKVFVQVWLEVITSTHLEK